jgi:hypothetical protein
MRVTPVFLLGLVAWNLTASALEPKPLDPSLQQYPLLKAPSPSGLVLKRGDRLAICGDSITEQKKYSRLMEDYLTMCVPELGVTVRQYGWSGEKAPGFLARMTNDCLRFKPTVATTCYGMNDHEYRPYEARIGEAYCRYSEAIIESFKAHDVRVIQGSPGCVGKIPAWCKGPNATVENMNLNLCYLRNFGVDMARAENVGFADVFWPMLAAGVEARTQYGANYAIAGADGVHPDWAGHTVMAYAFLKALGLKGEIGTLTVDLKANRMAATAGHKVVSAKDGEFEIRSSKYPFCPCLERGQGGDSYPQCGKDEVSRDSSIRSAMTLIPFNQDLNRFMLVLRNPTASNYKVTWGATTKSFSREQLERGVNLAEEFPCNPFCQAFGKVDAAVAAKQAFETKQIKQRFHGAEGKADMEKTVADTEKERQVLADAIKTAFVPVTHRIQIWSDRVPMRLQGRL